MTEPIFYTVNGEILEATGALREQIISDRENALTAEMEKIAKEESIANARASAITKLEALGLTLDEVSAAFGLSVD